MNFIEAFLTSYYTKLFTEIYPNQGEPLIRPDITNERWRIRLDFSMPDDQNNRPERRSAALIFEYTYEFIQDRFRDDLVILQKLHTPGSEIDTKLRDILSNFDFTNSSEH